MLGRGPGTCWPGRSHFLSLLPFLLTSEVAKRVQEPEKWTCCHFLMFLDSVMSEVKSLQVCGREKCLPCPVVVSKEVEIVFVFVCISVFVFLYLYFYICICIYVPCPVVVSKEGEGIIGLVNLSFTRIPQIFSKDVLPQELESTSKHL